MFYNQVLDSAAFIRTKCSQTPTVGIILGSGLGDFAETIEQPTVIPYHEIPNFPQSHVAGHAGNLVIGTVGGQVICAMQGRFHYYEGFTLREVTYPLYVMKLLGVESLIVTNACGAINPSFQPGDLVLLNDYINTVGLNPLTGPNDERFGPRFPDVSAPYSPALRAKADAAAKKLGISYQEGVYAWFGGPCYETAAEIRAFAAMGADAVGMSTVPETIVDNYMGMGVLGISCITNMATGIAKVPHTHEQVVKIANEASDRLCGWVKEILAGWAK